MSKSDKPSKPGKKPAVIDILKLEEGTLTFCVLGKTPIILNSLSEKTKRYLLLPPGKKTAADKAATLKHDPYEEYRAAPYTCAAGRTGPGKLNADPNSETFLQFLSTAFKKAMMQAALDLPDVSKAQIERLVWVNKERIDLYGIPRLLLSPVRSADQAHTPDIRSRPIIAQWACRLSVSFRRPILRDQGVANLLAAAGVTPGVGDWRVGKGSGSYGQFELVDADDPRFLAVIASGGYAAQLDAMKNPIPYNTETEELMAWFEEEKKRRGFGATVLPDDGEVAKKSSNRTKKSSNGTTITAGEARSGR